jgi:TonB family protein
MKIIALILLSCVCGVTGFAQQWEAKNDYKYGNQYLTDKDYAKAIKYYTNSIGEFNTAEALVNRAICYYALRDTCNYCHDLLAAKVMGDKEARNIYNKNCIYSLVNFKITDSLKQKYPEILYFEIVHNKCSSDSSLYAIRNLNGSRVKTEFSELEEGRVYSTADDMPSFAGGEVMLKKFLADSCNFPEDDFVKGIDGHVLVEFVVNKDGSVSNEKILKGIDPACDKEALHVVRMMPHWNPGKINGEAVRVKLTIPVYFKAPTIQRIQEKAAEDYKSGYKYFENKDFEKAIEYFSRSIKLNPIAFNYFIRAQAYERLSDTCNYCNDLHSASIKADKYAQKMYDQRCLRHDTIRVINDTILQEFPGCKYILKKHVVCDTNSWTVYYDTSDKYIVSIYEKMPEFPGGEKALSQYLSNNVVYPAEAKEKGIKGTVYASFYVNKNGTVSDITIERGIGGGCDEEVWRILKRMPKWEPATRKGIPFKVRFNMPLRFN